MYKAWLVREIGECYRAAVVFAETRGKARALAQHTDCCENSKFIDIAVYRMPQADKYYKNDKWHLDWSNALDRYALIRDCGFVCDYDTFDPEDCETCSGNEYCNRYLDFKAEQRNLVAISIKHTIGDYNWRFGMPCWLWGKRTEDLKKRSFSGYTQYVHKAEVYSLNDWAISGYNNCDWMKLDEPVHLCIDFCNKYKQYDTVLVPVDEYISYCKIACLPLE